MSAVREKVRVPPRFAFGLVAAGFATAGAGDAAAPTAPGDATGEADAATGEAAGEAAATGAIGLLVAAGAAAAGEDWAAGALVAEPAVGAGAEIGAQAAARPSPATPLMASMKRRLVSVVVTKVSP